MVDFDHTRSALLVIDFQNYGFDPRGYWASQGLPGWPARGSAAIENTARVVAAARVKGVTVIHVGQAWREGHPDTNVSAPWQAAAKEAGRTVEGTWGVDFFPPLTPAEGELVVFKRGVSALAGTELDRLLRIKSVTTLALAGVATNWAVEGTAREASDGGYRVIVLEDCCAAMTDEEHESSIRVVLCQIGTVITADEFIRSLGR